MISKAIFLNEALKLGGKAVRQVRSAKDSTTGGQALKVARAGVQNGPIKDVAMICGRAGVAGAVVDASMGAVQAFKAHREGKLDNKGAAKHVLSEASCGFITSSSGTAGTLAAYMLTGTVGPVALVAGMGASMGSRHLYRKVVGETLVDSSNLDDDKDKESHTPDMEEIGPKPSDSADA